MMEKLKLSNDSINYIEKLSRDLAVIQKGDTLSALWPFINNEAEYYIAERFIKDFTKALQINLEKNISLEDIAKLLEKPAKITQYTTYFHSLNGLDPSIKFRFTETIVKLLKIYKKDFLSLNYDNKLKEDYRGVIFEKLNFSSSQDHISSVKKINSLLLMYLETIYPTLMRLGNEIHGPYDYRNQKVIIREFYDLNPRDLNDIPYNKIKIIEKVEGDFSVDILNHLLNKPETKEIAILCNHSQISHSETEKFLSNLKTILMRNSQKNQGKVKKDWIKEFGKNMYYSIRHILSNANMSIKMPKEIINKIDQEDFNFPIEKARKYAKKYSVEEIENKIRQNLFKNVFKELIS